MPGCSRNGGGRAILAYFFGHTRDGHPVTTPPVVNLDGSPRNRLRDRLNRPRGEPEAMVAD